MKELRCRMIHKSGTSVGRAPSSPGEIIELGSQPYYLLLTLLVPAGLRPGRVPWRLKGQRTPRSLGFARLWFFSSPSGLRSEADLSPV